MTMTYARPYRVTLTVRDYTTEEVTVLATLERSRLVARVNAAELVRIDRLARHCSVTSARLLDVIERAVRVAAVDGDHQGWLAHGLRMVPRITAVAVDDRSLVAAA